MAFRAKSMEKRIPGRSTNLVIDADGLRLLAKIGIGPKLGKTAF
jgi:hypothetical protein